MTLTLPGWTRERRAAALGFTSIAGIDEAGRGALAGPVVAAAVILDPARCPAGIRDSKTLGEAAREKLYAEITSSARAWGVGFAEAGEIDASNIVVATRSAMMRALDGISPRPDYLIVDAVSLLEAGIACESPVKADRDVVSVAAASVIAKVTRDRVLKDLDHRYAGYGFARHKGYGTEAHLRALADRGPSPAHRMSFRPVFLPRLPGLEDPPGRPAGRLRGSGCRPSLAANAD